MHVSAQDARELVRAHSVEDMVDYPGSILLVLGDGVEIEFSKTFQTWRHYAPEHTVEGTVSED